MNTSPAKVKRARQEHLDTPIPAPSRKQRKMSLMELTGVYNPSVTRLKRTYSLEFGKFLKSLKLAMDNMELQKRADIIPMRQKLRRYHKESKSQHLYLKSLIYWKTFYTEFLNRIDDIMDCFRFEDIRDVAVVVKSHDFPEELVSYVTQQLMDWRELFLDVDWMKIYVEMSKKIEEQEKSRQEQEERFELLRVIALEIEMSNLSLAEFKPLNDQPEKLVVHVMGRISEETKAKTLADQLKSMPVLSRRCNTKEWCRKHYEALTSSSSSSSSSSASDDENNEENNSSIIGYCGDSSRDITSSTSSDEPDVETVDTFFSNYGL